MSAGSLRRVDIAGITFNAAADANVSLNPRIEKEAIPHSGGNTIKVTTVAANAEAVKLILTAAEYDILTGLAEDNDISVSYMMADGSVFRTTGAVTLGSYATEDGSCEVTLLTSTGKWDIFAET